MSKNVVIEIGEILAWFHLYIRQNNSTKFQNDTGCGKDGQYCAFLGIEEMDE